MIRTILSLIAVLMMLSGCATMYDVDLAGKHYTDRSTHSKEVTKRIEAKARAIERLMAVECNEDTAACGSVRSLSGAIAAREIADIKGDAYDGKAPTYSTDVQMKVLDTVQHVVNPVVTGVVAVKAIEQDKGSVVNQASDGATVNNSYDEDHATGINTGDGATSVTNTPSGNHEEVVFPPAE